jgi:hypothetical protein
VRYRLRTSLPVNLPPQAFLWFKEWVGGMPVMTPHLGQAAPLDLLDADIESARVNADGRYFVVLEPIA